MHSVHEVPDHASCHMYMCNHTACPISCGPATFDEAYENKLIVKVSDQINTGLLGQMRPVTHDLAC